MSARSQKEYTRKVQALCASLSNHTNPDAASLSKSFGLPEADVARIIRRMKDV